MTMYNPLNVLSSCAAGTAKRALSKACSSKYDRSLTCRGLLSSVQSPILPSSNNSNKNDNGIADVNIVEVGPRDGLQNERDVVPSTADKIEFIKLLHRAGCNHIEAGSFVSPKWVPSMADSDKVFQGLNKWRSQDTSISDDLVLSCLVPNSKGLQSAIENHADEIAIFGSASETFSQKNIACCIEESFLRFREVVETAKDKTQDNGLRIRGYVSCVIACPYEGKVSPSQVAYVAEQMLDLGCHEVSLGDTIGVGTPGTVVPMLIAVQEAIASDRLAVHFHDTYGQALANILVSLERGISTVDSSVAGLGGCPYAGEGASGNVATEDVVYMLDGLGATTGIDLHKLVDAGEFICRALKQKSRSRAGSAIAATRKRQG